MLYTVDKEFKQILFWIVAGLLKVLYEHKKTWNTFSKPRLDSIVHNIYTYFTTN